MRKILFLLLIASLFYSCKKQADGKAQQKDELSTASTVSFPTVGSIERLDPALDALIPKDAELEIVADSFVWSEGPVWVETHQMLLFSDIPPNKIYKWTEEKGLEDYLHPSGYTGEGEYSYEPGSNGLLLDGAGNLILCQHGDRRLARMEASLSDPNPTYTTLVDNWDGKKLNSPNDAVFLKSGDLLFTDPPYGLPKRMEDPTKEIPFQGVYFLDIETKEAKLLTDEMSRPNGINIAPDEKTVYVANSDPEKAIWMAFDWDGATFSNGRVFFDATDKVGTEKGLPDGLKVDDKGNVWATGPGGVWVFSPEGKHLGTIKTGQATANCAFNTDFSEFYMTADMYIMRLKLK